MPGSGTDRSSGGDAILPVACQDRDVRTVDLAVAVEVAFMAQVTPPLPSTATPFASYQQGS